MANNNDARRRPIFVDKDSHPLRFYLDESINKGPRKLLQKNIEKHGGTVVVRAAHAEYVLISKKADRCLKQASYVTSTNPAKQALNIQYMSMIQNSIEHDTLTVEIDVVKRMSGNLGRKSGYTPQEDRNLAIWIATQIPNINSGGRKGDNLYKRLEELGETDAKFAWVKTHPWQSWQNRYKKNPSKFDELVEEVIPLVNPRRIHRFETDRKAGKSRLLGGRQFGDDEEDPESEDDQSSRRSTPAQLPSRDGTHWGRISSVVSERHQSTLLEQPSRAGDTDSARDHDEVAMELEPSDEPSTHSRSQGIPSSSSQQTRARPSDLEMPPSKRQRTGNSSQPVPTQNPGPRRGAYHPANAQESEESDSSEENENESFAEVTFLDDPGDHVTSENAPLSKSPEEAVPSAPRHTISQGSTLVGTAPKLSLNRDEEFEQEGENIEENESLNEEFARFPPSPNQGPIAGDSVGIQAPSPSPVPQAVISPPRPVPRPIASNAKTRKQRTPPPPRMTRARSRSQSVEPVFQSLPSRKAKGKGKADPPPLSPQFESLQEEQEQSRYLNSHEVEHPRETLEDEEDVRQLVTNEQDYTPDISRTEEEFEAEYDEPGVGGISLAEERLSTHRAPFLESDDEEMSVQLGMKPPPPPSPPKQPPRRTAKPDIGAALAELRDAPRRKRAPLNLPLDQLIAGIGSRPRGSLNSTRDRSFKQRTRDSTTGAKQVGSGSPFRRVVPRATSTTSSQETFPLQGTRASEYKRRKTQEDLLSPYKPPQGTRASALKSSPPN